MTWVFGILSVTDAGLVFQYIFTILNSLQVGKQLINLMSTTRGVLVESSQTEVYLRVLDM